MVADEVVAIVTEDDVSVGKLAGGGWTGIPEVDVKDVAFFVVGRAEVAAGRVAQCWNEGEVVAEVKRGHST